MKIDKKWIDSQSIACVAAISEDQGVDLVHYHKRSIDSFDFAKFLKAIREKYPDDLICCFFDQLRVHTSNHVRQTLIELNLDYMLNAAYYPDGNGIEYIFSKVK